MTGFSSEDEERFWSVLSAFDAAQRSAFAVFVSACSRRPPEGWQRLQLKVQRNGDGDERLPTAFTCYTLLLLPRYSSAEVLRARLLAAISETEDLELCRGGEPGILTVQHVLMEPQRSDEGPFLTVSPMADFKKICSLARAPHTRFQLHFESVLAKVSGHAPADFVVCAEAQGIGGQAFLVHNTRIKPEWLTELAPHYFKQVRAGEARQDL
eukprot:s6582_g2.t1